MVKKKKRSAHKSEAIEKKLNPRQTLFCVLYTQDKECFGNGSLSYMRAYNLKEKQRPMARINAYQLLTHPHIRNYVNGLLDEKYNNIAVDRRHSALIHQDKNLIVSMQAVIEYNKVKNRVKEAELKVGPVVFYWEGDERKKAPFKTSTPANILPLKEFKNKSFKAKK